MDATGAILFFGFVGALLLLGVGVGAYLGLLPGDKLSKWD